MKNKIKNPYLPIDKIQNILINLIEDIYKARHLYSYKDNSIFNCLFSVKNIQISPDHKDEFVASVKTTPINFSYLYNWCQDSIREIDIYQDDMVYFKEYLVKLKQQVKEEHKQDLENMINKADNNFKDLDNAKNKMKMYERYLHMYKKQYNKTTDKSQFLKDKYYV